MTQNSIDFDNRKDSLPVFEESYRVFEEMPYLKFKDKIFSNVLINLELNEVKVNDDKLGLGNLVSQRIAGFYATIKDVA
jgi:hypothetical protein